MKLVFDLEANGWVQTATQVWCGCVRRVDTEQVWSFTPDTIEDLLSLLSKADALIGHNIIGYDLPLLKRLYGWEPPEHCQVIDTWILSQMLYPDQQRHPKTSGKKGPHSLENYGNIFGVPKPEHEEWDKFSPEMLHRCSEDVHITYLTFHYLNRKADVFNKGSKWYRPYRFDAAFFKELVLQADNGILISQEKSQGLLKRLTDRINEIDTLCEPELPYLLVVDEQKVKGEYKYNAHPFTGSGALHANTRKWCENTGVDTGSIGGPFTRVHFEKVNLGSGDQVKELLLASGWIPKEWNTKEDPVTGKITRTSPKISQDEEFEGVTGDLGKLVAERMICVHRKSQLEGILSNVRPDGRISAVVTGFTPTARARHAVVVNLPGGSVPYGPEFRDIFVCAPGRKLVGCDAASCQLRNLCNWMGDAQFTHSVISGKQSEGTDVHTVNMKAAGLPDRTAAKRFIYGFLFGAGDGKVGAIIGKGAAEGKKIKEKYLANLPLLKQLIDRLKQKFKIFKYIDGIDGREIYPRSNHEVLCYQLQSDEAIIMKIATLYVMKWIRERKLDAFLVWHMHDEYGFDCAEQDAQEVAELAAKAITKAGELLKMKVPMAGDAKIGNSWWEVH